MKLLNIVNFGSHFVKNGFNLFIIAYFSRPLDLIICSEQIAYRILRWFLSSKLEHFPYFLAIIFARMAPINYPACFLFLSKYTLDLQLKYTLWIWVNIFILKSIFVYSVALTCLHLNLIYKSKTCSLCYLKISQRIDLLICSFLLSNSIYFYRCEASKHFILSS
jgi:hypothetical protein